MRIHILAAAVAAVIVPMASLAGEAPVIAPVGPFIGVDAGKAQVVFLDQGSVRKTNSDVVAVFLILNHSGADGTTARLEHIHIDCNTGNAAEMDQTFLDAAGKPTRSETLDNKLLPTIGGSVGAEMGSAVCVGAPKMPDGKVFAIPSLSDVLAWAKGYF